MSTGDASLSPPNDRNRTADCSTSKKVRSDRQRNSLAPINKLPVELLLQVFREAIPEEERYTSKRLLEVGSVQAHWWNVITETPELWTFCSQEASLKTVMMKFMRSKDRPLFIKCRTDKDCDNTKHFIRHVSTYIHRWKSFAYEGEDFKPLHTHLSYLSAPLLEVLRLKVPPRDGGEPPTVYVEGGPLLRHVHLEGTIPSLPATVLSNLQTLSIGNLDYLDLLPVELADVLQACPHLQALALHDIEDCRATFEPEDALPTTLELPKLQSVHLTDVCHVTSAFLFQSLHLNPGVRFHFSLDDPWGNALDGLDQYEVLIAARKTHPSFLSTIVADPAIVRVEAEIREGIFKIQTESSTREILSSIRLATAWDVLAMRKLPFRTSQIPIDLKYHTSFKTPDENALYVLLRGLGNVTSISWNCSVVDCRVMCRYLEEPGGAKGWPCPNLSEIIIAKDFAKNIGRHPWRMVMEYFHDLVTSRREEPTVSNVEVFDHDHNLIHDVKEFLFPG